MNKLKTWFYKIFFPDKYFSGSDVSEKDNECNLEGYKEDEKFYITNILFNKQRNICDYNLLTIFSIGKLTIAVYDRWLGFEYIKFGNGDKRKDFGFIKFWLNK